MLTWSIPKPRHLGGAKADWRGRLDGNGLTNAPPPPNGLVPEAVETAGFSGWCRKCGWKPCSKWAP